MNPPPKAGGLKTSLRAGLNAGMAAGLVLGLVDGVGAGLRTGTHGVVDWLGCLAAAGLMYGLVFAASGLLLALGLHVWLRKFPLGERLSRVLALLLGLGLFVGLVWWTRPWVFPGLSVTDPRRLAVSAVLLPIGIALGFVIVRLGARLPRGVRWAGAALVPFAWLGGGAFLYSTSSDTGELGRVNDRTRALPNVLLFVCDAMRADKLGCYGDERVQTPRIDALAKEGVVFERAFVQAPFTGSSFGSYFTGKYPRRHGFVRMAPDTRMAPNVTIASHLKDAKLVGGGTLERDDYHCVTFMTGALSTSAGLARGFDSYFESFMGHHLVDVDDPWSLFSSELLLYIARTKLAQKFDATPVASEASRWLRANGTKRFFAMVHLFATHTPYDPPPEIRALYNDPDYKGPVSVFRSDHAFAIHEGRAKPTEADERQIRDLYDGGVTYTDRQIELVLRELEAQGRLDDTLVIVTADHGEELGEHGVWEHNHMYQSNLRVPLVLHWPRKLPLGKRSDALVESIDLLPTLCDVLGLELPVQAKPDEDEQGRDYGKIDGKSVLPLLDGRASAIREFSFAENGIEMSVQDLRWKLVVPAVDGDNRPLELAGESLESLSTRGIARPRLYDLENDPQERANVLEKAPDEARRLLAALAEWDASLPIPRLEILMSERDVTENARRMAELGYGDGVGKDLPKAPEKQ
ncbi:MAG: sulfatase [Planctomycetaceae bacterium]|nr:sulfatase [Planctomycetaceae bacterium]